MAPFVTKRRAEMFSMIENTSERYENNTEKRLRRRAKPYRISIRETKEGEKANGEISRYQTSLGVAGETNFMSLPGELRNEICRLALVEPDTIRLRLRHEVRPHPLLGWTHHSDAKPWREPSLLSVNKSIRLEASSVYYGLNEFGVGVYPEDMGEVAAWLRSVVSRCGNNPFRQFHFFVTVLQFHWADLYSMLPLVQVFAELGLKLDSGVVTHRTGGGFRRTAKGSKSWSASRMHEPVEYKTVPVPLFVMSCKRRAQLHHAIEEAVELGIQAHKENWAEDWVEIKFEEWFDEKIEGHLERHKERRSMGSRRSMRIANARNGAGFSEQG